MACRVVLPSATPGGHIEGTLSTPYTKGKTALQMPQQAAPAHTHIWMHGCCRGNACIAGNDQTQRWGLGYLLTSFLRISFSFCAAASRRMTSSWVAFCQSNCCLATSGHSRSHVAAACVARKVHLFDRPSYGLSYLSMLWKPFEVAFHTQRRLLWQGSCQAMWLLPAVLVVQ